jgi:hypothetical protein
VRDHPLTNLQVHAVYNKEKVHLLEMKMDDHMLQYGNNIAHEGDFLKFNGNNSYVGLADMSPSGTDYEAYVHSGTWSMTLWVKPSTDDENSRILSLRLEDLGFFVICENRFLWQEHGDGFAKESSIDEWDFYAVSVDNHALTVHTSKTAAPGALVTFERGTWDVSSLDRERMIIGGNAYNDIIHDNRMWGGHTSMFTMRGEPQTSLQVHALYNEQKVMHGN